MLTEAQTLRFARHVLVRELGGTGQVRLLAATVRLPRLDENGRACALWLARAGVGRLLLPDDRSPAPSHDGSGLLYAEDEGKPLAEVVIERLRQHGPDTRVKVVGTAAGDPADARAGVDPAADFDASITESGVTSEVGGGVGGIVDLDPAGGAAAVLGFIAKVAGLDADQRREFP